MIDYMGSSEALISTQARLPDGQLVVIEDVEDEIAWVRRVGGPWDDEIAVCKVEKLLECEPTSH